VYAQSDPTFQKDLPRSRSRTVQEINYSGSERQDYGSTSRPVIRSFSSSACTHFMRSVESWLGSWITGTFWGAVEIMSIKNR
jgi:hypothetical protein